MIRKDLEEPMGRRTRSTSASHGVCRRRLFKWWSYPFAQAADFSTLLAIALSYHLLAFRSMFRQPSNHSSSNNYGRQTQPELPFARSRRPFDPVRDSIQSETRSSTRLRPASCATMGVAT
ncbi:hypothetical protein FA95DRAFT_222223 [Auriscalpium vulgare]|uniref:Uncharacterized protein n=1 Tax=Auriscalpium vulgare TaxID=40419 RepID=A0ACB8RLJ0_9AGAM|nr:hypothetical protein FA95DRAFT_222223 [Auriscalpium vulgare]